MKMKLLRAISTVGVALFAASLTMSAQDTPQPVQASIRTKQAAKPPSKNVHKVWSNDDVDSLRTPADRYLEAKEARSAAQATATEAAAVTPTPNPPAKPPAPAPAPASIKLPETIEQTKQAINEEARDTNDIRESLRQLKDEVYASPESSRAKKQIQIDRLNSIIDANEADLKLLEDHLQKLVARQPGGNSTTPK